MNILDRAIALVSPERAVKRTRARALTSAMTRGYDAAKSGRRVNGWIAAGTSANAEIAGALPFLRWRSRELVRNNPYAARAIDILAANVIGAGIRPEGVDERAMALWARWAETPECDADGQLDFYGLQRLIARTVEESGECLVRFRPRRTEDGLSVPLQLQVLEPDFLDPSKDGVLPNGGEVAQGIEFDPLGRRAAYWLFRRHPGDTRLTGIESVRVPASEVLHIYDKKRPGQTRGVPRLSTVAIKMRDLDEYQEAALVKAKVEACLSAFVARSDAGEITPIAPSETDADGNRIESLEPGMIMYGAPGESVDVINPSSSGGYEPFTLQSLMAIAAGIGITYDQLTGDLRQANYSSLRAGKIEFRRLVEQMQWMTYVPMLCAPVWRRFIEAAVLSGALPNITDGYPAEWSPPRHEPIDPKKDLEADVLEVRAGGMTLPQFIAKRGYDPARQLKEIAATNATLDQLAITLDTDPRREAQQPNNGDATDE